LKNKREKYFFSFFGKTEDLIKRTREGYLSFSGGQVNEK